MNTSTNKRKQQPVNSSILESLRDLSGGIRKTVTNDLAGGVSRDAFRSVFGNPVSSSEDLQSRKEYGFSRENDGQPVPMRAESVRLSVKREDERELGMKIDAVRTELKALSASIRSLSAEVEKSVQETPVDPGIYHLNYFERLLAVLRLMRQEIEDSRTWLTMWSSRRKQRSYWRMYKKHGTTFGLSHERTMATQAG